MNFNVVNNIPIHQMPVAIVESVDRGYSTSRLSKINIPLMGRVIFQDSARDLVESMEAITTNVKSTWSEAINNNALKYNFEYLEEIDLPTIKPKAIKQVDILLSNKQRGKVDLKHLEEYEDIF